VPGSVSNHFDHWGRTTVCGLDAFVTEPYSSVEELGQQMRRLAHLLGAVPALAGRGSWNDGTLRGLLFDRRAVLEAAAVAVPVAPASSKDEDSGMTLAELMAHDFGPEPGFDHLFTRAYTGEFSTWRDLLGAGLPARCVPSPELRRLLDLEPRLNLLLSVAAGWRHRLRKGIAAELPAPGECS
jgi:hypothetical protein